MVAIPSSCRQFKRASTDACRQGSANPGKALICIRHHDHTWAPYICRIGFRLVIRSGLPPWPEPLEYTCRNSLNL